MKALLINTKWFLTNMFFFVGRLNNGNNNMTYCYIIVMVNLCRSDIWSKEIVFGVSMIILKVRKYIRYVKKYEHNK